MGTLAVAPSENHSHAATKKKSMVAKSLYLAMELSSRIASRRARGETTNSAFAYTAHWVR